MSSSNVDLRGSFSVRTGRDGKFAIEGSRTPTGGGRCGAGFMFGFSTDGDGHEFVATVDYFGPGIAVMAAGLDPWIRELWPGVFAGPVFFVCRTGRF